MHLCSVLSSVLSSDWALLDCVIDRKVRDIIFEAILSPSERYQNIQDNPEYNSVLPAVNMLFLYISLHPLFHLLRLHVTSCVYNM